MDITMMLLGLSRLKELGYDDAVVHKVLSSKYFATEQELMAALDAEQATYIGPVPQETRDGE